MRLFTKSAFRFSHYKILDGNVCKISQCVLFPRHTPMTMEAISRYDMIAGRRSHFIFDGGKSKFLKSSSAAWRHMGPEGPSNFTKKLKGSVLAIFFFVVT